MLRSSAYVPTQLTLAPGVFLTWAGPPDNGQFWFFRVFRYFEHISFSRTAFRRVLEGLGQQLSAGRAKQKVVVGFCDVFARIQTAEFAKRMEYAHWS